MRALQRLVRNGNSNQVAIAKKIFDHLGWKPGEFVVVELLESGELRVRRPQVSDFLSNHPTGQLMGVPGELKS